MSSIYVRYPSQKLVLQKAWYDSSAGIMIAAQQGYFILEYPSELTFFIFRKVYLEACLPKDFDYSQIVTRLKLEELEAIPYVMTLETATDIISGHSNGTIEPRTPTTNEIDINGGRGGRFWLNGEFTLEEIEALVVIGKHQLQVSKDYQHSLKGTKNETANHLS